MLLRSTAQRPQRVLQTLRQGDEALAAQHHMGVLPVREGKAEVIQPVMQRNVGDGDAKLFGVGEIRQGLLTRRMFLPEDNLSLGAMQRLPQPDPSLQRATQM